MRSSAILATIFAATIGTTSGKNHWAYDQCFCAFMAVIWFVSTLAGRPSSCLYNCAKLSHILLVQWIITVSMNIKHLCVIWSPRSKYERYFLVSYTRGMAESGGEDVDNPRASISSSVFFSTRSSLTSAWRQVNDTMRPKSVTRNWCSPPEPRLHHTPRKGIKSKLVLRAVYAWSTKAETVATASHHAWLIIAGTRIWCKYGRWCL